MNKFHQDKEHGETMEESAELSTIHDNKGNLKNDLQLENGAHHVKRGRLESGASSVNSEVNSAYDSDEEKDQNEEEKIRRGKTLCCFASQMLFLSSLFIAYFLFFIPYSLLLFFLLKGFSCKEIGLPRVIVANLFPFSLTFP